MSKPVKFNLGDHVYIIPLRQAGRVQGITWSSRNAETVVYEVRHVDFTYTPDPYYPVSQFLGCSYKSSDFFQSDLELLIPSNVLTAIKAEYDPSHVGILQDLLNKPSQPVCECGKEKHGFASHSNWCQLSPSR